MEIGNGSISNVPSSLYPPLGGGLTYSCLIPLPDYDAFVITGGEKYETYQWVQPFWYYHNLKVTENNINSANFVQVFNDGNAELSDDVQN